jgi:hypothetical protein
MTPPPASPSFEVQLVDEVDRVAGREAVTVQRHANGGLRVVGVVQHEDIEQRLRAAIRRLDPRGVVQTEVASVASAAARAVPGRGASGSWRVEAHTLPAGAAPFEAYLRAARPMLDGAAVARGLAPEVLQAVGEVRLHARALHSLTQRYPDTLVATLDSAGLAAWQGLLTRRRSGARLALTRLHALVQPYVDVAPPPFGAARPGTTDLASEPRRPHTVGSLAHALDHEAVLLHEALSRLFLASDDEAVPAREVVVDLASHLRAAMQLVLASDAALERTGDDNDR